MYIITFFEIFWFSFSMSSSTTAPYLADDKAQFRMSFMFFDAALSTSEIRPLHLGMPGKKSKLSKPRSPIKKYASSGPVNKNMDATLETINEDDDTNISLAETSNRLAARPRNRNKVANLNRSMENMHPVSHGRIPKTRIKSIEINATSPDSLLSKSSSQEAITGEGLNPISITAELSLQGLYFLPCAPSQYMNFTFKIMDDKKKFIRYTLINNEDKENPQRLRADVFGQSRGSRIEIYYEVTEIGEMRYNAYQKYQNACFTGLKPPVELAAMLFNPSYMNSNHPKIFDLVIPALKKVNGRYQSFNVNISEQSLLVQYISRMAKEAIRIKPRIPSSDGGIYETTFDGKFQLTSLNNFILFHETNHKRDICTFCKFDDTTYNLTVGYPMSPIQAFITAITASLPV